MSEIKTGEEQPAFCYTELFQSNSYFGYKYPVHMLPLQISSLTSFEVYYKQDYSCSSHSRESENYSYVSEDNSTIVLHLMFYKYSHNWTLPIFMLIFRVPNRCISTSVLEGTVYISHDVQDINIQLFTTILNLVWYTIMWCTYYLMMNPWDWNILI
jgi:hypothetical protein